MGHDILVDGYNVIKNNVMFRSIEEKSLEHARHLLIRHLHYRYRRTSYTVTVVFDGDGAQQQERHEDHIRVIFSRRGETADRVIARVAAQARKAGHVVEMYSDDREVQQAVAEQGAQPRSTTHLNAQLNPPPSDVAQRARHRLEVRRWYSTDPSYKPEDDREPYHPPRRKKKKSSHRRGK